MAWFYTMIIMYAGQPPFTRLVGPFPTEQACQTDAITTKVNMPIVQTTECTRERRHK
jgi:hypothetical protein